MSDKTGNECLILNKKKIETNFLDVVYNVLTRSNRSNSQMSSTTITLPHSFTAAIKEVAATARAQAIDSLSARYGFPAEEAHRFLSDTEIKIEKKRGPSAKPKGKSKPKDDKPKKKRAQTGYLLFSAENRAYCKERMSEDLEDGEKLKPQDVVKELARRWAELDEEERLDWKVRALPAIEGAEGIDEE